MSCTRTRERKVSCPNLLKMRPKKWSSDVGTRQTTQICGICLKKEKQTNKKTTTTTTTKKSNKEQKKGKRFANPKKGRKTDRNEGIMT